MASESSPLQVSGAVTRLAVYRAAPHRQTFGLHFRDFLKIRLNDFEIIESPLISSGFDTVGTEPDVHL